MQLGGLDESRWSIVSVRMDSGLEATIDGGDGTEFTFLGDGRFAGSTGCNRFFGQFMTTDHGSLSAGPVGITMMMCPDDRMTQERHILAALEETGAVATDADQVELLDGDGTTLMVLRPMP